MLYINQILFTEIILHFGKVPYLLPIDTTIRAWNHKKKKTNLIIFDHVNINYNIV